jgi:hypothetical protein
MRKALSNLYLQEKKQRNLIDVHIENPKIKKFPILLGNKPKSAPYEE